MFPRRGTTGANCQRTACSPDGPTCYKVDLLAANTIGKPCRTALFLLVPVQDNATRAFSHNV